MQIKKSSDKKDWADNLTDAQLASLEKGLSDEKNNRILKSSDFWGNIKKLASITILKDITPDVI